MVNRSKLESALHAYIEQQVSELKAEFEKLLPVQPDTNAVLDRWVLERYGIDMSKTEGGDHGVSDSA